jgi:putative DNA primase/helicase
MYFWQNEFWEWNGRYYATIEPEIIRDRVYAFLDASWKFSGGAELTRFKPNPKLVSDVLDALKAGLTLPATCQPPMWLDSGELATDVLVFRDGLVNVLTGERSALTPKLWVHSAVTYKFDPLAQCPVWERFLEQIFPGDKESQDCIEEQLGYGMTEETKFQKAALWIGRSRSGKGTAAFVQRKLIGDSAYVGLSFSTWVTNENSRAPLIGKRVGVFPDLRVKTGKYYGASYDAGGISHTSQELLLAITGEDTLTLGRKWKGEWHGQLRLKLILISNEVPNFNDKILVSRFVKVKFGQSFYGKEDIDLRQKLEVEISGIAVRCMAAYRRLIRRGKFIQPQSANDLERKILAESDPWTKFVYDTFVIDVSGMVSCALVKLKFETWCGEHGRADLRRSAPTASLLTQRLSAVDGLEALRTYRPHGGQRSYVGLRLKTSDEA